MITLIHNGEITIIQNNRKNDQMVTSDPYFNARNRKEIGSWYRNDKLTIPFTAWENDLSHWEPRTDRGLPNSLTTLSSGINHSRLAIDRDLNVELLSSFTLDGKSRIPGTQKFGKLSDDCTLLAGGRVAATSRISTVLRDIDKPSSTDFAMAISKLRNTTPYIFTYSISIQDFIEGYKKWLDDKTYRVEDTWVIDQHGFFYDVTIGIDDLEEFTYGNIDKWD